MSERTKGVYGLLQHPWLYEAVQKTMRPDEFRQAFAVNHIRAKPGDRVIDIGCGPAEILRFLSDVRYDGWEPNPDYVRQAQARFGDKGTFHVGFFGEKEAEDLRGTVDVAIVSAVLHHMNDAEATNLFALLKTSLKPGGRVVSIDNVYVKGQNLIAKLLIALDRGRNVRTAEGYKSLAQGSFGSIDGLITHKRFPPYTHFIMTAS